MVLERVTCKESKPRPQCTDSPREVVDRQLANVCPSVEQDGPLSLRGRRMCLISVAPPAHKMITTANSFHGPYCTSVEESVLPLLLL